MSKEKFERELIAESEAIRFAMEAACKRQANIVVGKDVPNSIRGANIFMGIGLITGQKRISHGLGLGFINMTCLAREIQKRLDEQKKPTKIVCLIADQQALDQTEEKEHDKVLQVSSAVALSSQRMFQFLECPDNTVEIIRASSPHWPTIESLDYIEQETKDILHAHQKLGCGIKIGWQTKRKRKKGAEPIRDEQWFDQEALARHPEELATMAFIRGPEWLSLSTHLDREQVEQQARVVKRIVTVPKPYSNEEISSIIVKSSSSAHNLPLPPYFGDCPEFVLGQPINLEELTRQKVITKQMKRALLTIDGSIRKTLDINERAERSLVFLQGLIDACCL